LAVSLTCVFLSAYIDFWNISEDKTIYILNLATYDVVKYNRSTVIHNYTRSKQMTKTAHPSTTCTLQLSRKNQKAGDNKFRAAMLEAIDEGFSSFSRLNKQEIYFHVENIFKIRKEEIPCRIEDFADAIEQILGVGAKLIEIRIIEALHKRIPDFMFSPKKGAVIFKEYVASLRIFLLQS
jgi:hypothetical protein